MPYSNANVYIAVTVILLLVFIVILVGCCVLKQNHRISRIDIACRRRFFESRRKLPSEPRYVVTDFGKIDETEDTYDHLRVPRIDKSRQNLNTNIYGHLGFGNEEEYDVMNFGGNNTRNVDLTYARAATPNYGNTLL